MVGVLCARIKLVIAEITEINSRVLGEDIVSELSVGKISLGVCYVLNTVVGFVSSEACFPLSSEMRNE